MSKIHCNHSAHHSLGNCAHEFVISKYIQLFIRSMSDVELEQPVFGANYIRGKIRAQQNGNWTGETKFKISFKSGGCIDFGQALLRAATMAQRNGGGMVSSRN